MKGLGQAGAGNLFHGRYWAGQAGPGARARHAWYHGAVLAIVAAAIYANLPIYFYVLAPAILPKYMFLAMFLLMAPLVMLRRPALAAYLLSPFMLWASLLLLLNLASLAALAPGGELGGAWLADVMVEPRRALILTRMQYLLFAMLLGFAIHARADKSWLWALWLLALLLPSAVLVDFALPGLLYPLDTGGAVLGRAAATFINPNMAGEALLQVLLLACVVTPPRWRAALLLLAGAAILSTFSRAAIVAWVLLLMILACAGSLPRSGVVLCALTLAAGVLCLGAFESWLLGRSGFDDATGNILARLDFFSSYSFDDDSSEERARVLRAGWELFLQNPVFGAGSGATLFWSHRGSTHNQLVLLAAEYGVFGLGMWLWLLAILCRGRFFSEPGLKLAAVFLFVFMSMFTHSMLDASVYWLATFALASSGTGSVRHVWRGRTGPVFPRGAPAGDASGVATDLPTWTWEAVQARSRPGKVAQS